MDMTSPNPDPREKEWAHDMAATARAVDHAAPDLAAAYWSMYQELIEQGFDEKQAIELLTEFEVNL